MKKMTNEEFNEWFRKRTRAFAIAVIKFLETVVPNPATKVMSYLLCKAATSVGANFRAFCRSRSPNERFSKICIVVEEADESGYWLEVFNETDYCDKKKLPYLINEAEEILKLASSTRNTLFEYKAL